MNEPRELQKLQWENKALKDDLTYLVETKDYAEMHGKDPIYLARKRLGWQKARSLVE